METIIIRSNAILAPNGLIRGSVIVKSGAIAALQDHGVTQLPPGRVIDVGDLYVSPGFIDMHTHGGGGFDFMDGTPEAMIGAAKAHMRHGTTALLPTSLTCPEDELFNLYDCYQAAKRTMRDGPALLGLHLEGPYFSPSQKGAQDEAFLRIPEQSHVKRLLDGSGDIRRVSAAPELPFGLELGDTLRARGILASIGHSNANYDCVREAIAHGYCHVTHLYSGMSALHREGPYRVLGLVESAYLEDGLSVELIADGVHLPPELLRLILRSKAHESICLVTDSMRGAGLPDGVTVKLGSLAHGQDVIVRDGVAMLPDNTAFAGSVCTADRCIRTIYRLGVLSMWESVMLMTRNPARVLGIAQKGTLAPGMDADLCIFDGNVDIKAVMVGGRFTHSDLPDSI